MIGFLENASLFFEIKSYSCLFFFKFSPFSVWEIIIFRIFFRFQWFPSILLLLLNILIDKYFLKTRNVLIFYMAPLTLVHFPLEFIFLNSLLILFKSSIWFSDEMMKLIYAHNNNNNHSNLARPFLQQFNSNSIT